VKKFVRTPWVQSTLAWLVSGYLAVTLATMRWRFENRAPADAVVASPSGIVACFWHGSIALAVISGRVLRSKPRRVLISNSPDGELIAKIVHHLGFPAIRGSTTMDDRADRRSIGAFRDAVKFLDAGGVVAITPDGPRGPAEIMPEGPLMIARRRGTPVFLCGLAARPAVTLRSWDKARIPLPFSRGCMVFEGPLAIGRETDAAAIEATRLEWQSRLSAAQARAEALLAA